MEFIVEFSKAGMWDVIEKRYRMDRWDLVDYYKNSEVIGNIYEEKEKQKLVKNEKLAAGWLSPSGEYFRLESHHLCHEDLAQEILSGEDYLEESELATNVLLKRKWAIIRDKKFYCSKTYYFVWWGLTVEQKHFFKPYIEDGEIIEADIY